MKNTGYLSCSVNCVTGVPYHSSPYIIYKFWCSILKSYLTFLSCVSNVIRLFFVTRRIQLHPYNTPTHTNTRTRAHSHTHTHTNSHTHTNYLAYSLFDIFSDMTLITNIVFNKSKEFCERNSTKQIHTCNSIL